MNEYIHDESKKCPNCGTPINTINFIALMTEQWLWNGHAWECCAHHSLATDREQDVRCDECDAIVGTGIDFGF
jgi:hypothetical protein